MPDDIQIIKEVNCPSLSGTSDITYLIGNQTAPSTSASRQQRQRVLQRLLGVPAVDPEPAGRA